MKNAKISYTMDSYHEFSVHSFEELLTILQKVKSEAKDFTEIIFSADVAVEGAGCLSVGLDQQCILTYTSEDFDEALTSLGDEAAQGETLYYFGDHTSMSNKYIIPFAKALEALQIWVEQGELSDSIEWTSKLF